MLRGAGDMLAEGVTLGEGGRVADDDGLELTDVCVLVPTIV